ncbi:MAG: hypothetical protein V1712_03120 [Patescibacteria group bacterium]
MTNFLNEYAEDDTADYFQSSIAYVYWLKDTIKKFYTCFKNYESEIPFPTDDNYSVAINWLCLRILLRMAITKVEEIFNQPLDSNFDIDLGKRISKGELISWIKNSCKMIEKLKRKTFKPKEWRLISEAIIHLKKLIRNKGKHCGGLPSYLIATDYPNVDIKILI